MLRPKQLRFFERKIIESQGFGQFAQTAVKFFIEASEEHVRLIKKLKDVASNH